MTRRQTNLVALAMAASVAVGYVAGITAATSEPEVVTRTVTVPVVPPACREAVRLSLAQADAATDYAVTALKVAPLVADAYNAGKRGNPDPPLLDRVADLNREARRDWRAATEATDRAAGAAQECRNP